MKIATHIALSADKILMYLVDGAYSTFFFNSLLIHVYKGTIQ